MKRTVLAALITLAIAPATGAGSTEDTRPPDEVLAFFENGAAAAFTDMTSDPAVGDTADGASRTASPNGGDISFGLPRTVHRFTAAYLRGNTDGDIVEPDGTWIAPVSDGDGDSVGTALVWYPEGDQDPEVAAIEWDPELGERLASAPADPLIRFDEDNAWFTLQDDQLRGLDGSRVSVATYGKALASRTAEMGTDSGGAATLVPDSVIFQPRGIATALAIAAASALVGLVLRRRHRSSPPRTPPDGQST